VGLELAKKGKLGKEGEGPTHSVSGKEITPVGITQVGRVEGKPCFEEKKQNRNRHRVDLDSRPKWQLLGENRQRSRDRVFQGPGRPKINQVVER